MNKMTLKKLLLKLLFFITSILLFTVIFNHVMDTGSKDHLNYHTLKLTMNNSFKPGPIYADNEQSKYRNLSSSNSSTENYLDSLELKNVVPDFAFVSKSCDNNLDMKQWAPASVKAKICLFPLSKDRFVSHSIKHYGNWETGIQKHIFSQVFPLFPKAAFVDIGGHLGTFSISAAKLGRQVFTFEPVKETLEYLATSVRVNSLQQSMHVYPVALMDQRYMCVHSKDNPTNSGGRAVRIEYDQCSPQSSKAATLDDLLPIFQRLNLSEAILKMDCEESEPYAVLGGLKFFQEISVPFIAMEFSAIKDRMKKGNDRKYDLIAEKFLEQMEKMNYVPTPVGGDLARNLTKVNHFKWPSDINWVKVAKKLN